MSELENELLLARPDALPSAEATHAAHAAVSRYVDEPAAGRRWRDRSHLRLRRPTLVWAVAALLLAVAGPAVAYVAGVVDFRSTEPAPFPIQKQFNELFVSGAPPAMDPRALPLSTRKVKDFNLPDGRHTLWVAPTAGGGFCKVFTDFAGGCVATRNTPPGRVVSSTEVRPWLLDVTTAFESPGPPGPVRIGGHLLAPYPATLVIEYEDGDSEEVPLTFVSRPIDAGFFLFSIPPRHRKSGHTPTRLTARTTEGDVIAQTVEQVNPPAGPR
jgi:hypothetical protein